MGVLAGELLGAFVANGESGPPRGRSLALHQPARLHQAELFLELAGRERGDRFEVLVERGRAHARCVGKHLDS